MPALQDADDTCIASRFELHCTMLYNAFACIGPLVLLLAVDGTAAVQ